MGDGTVAGRPLEAERERSRRARGGDRTAAVAPQVTEVRDGILARGDHRPMLCADAAPVQPTEEWAILGSNQ